MNQMSPLSQQDLLIYLEIAYQTLKYFCCNNYVSPALESLDLSDEQLQNLYRKLASYME